MCILCAVLATIRVCEFMRSGQYEIGNRYFSITSQGVRISLSNISMWLAQDIKEGQN